MERELTENPLFRIDYDGQWFHDGAPIRRHELARLFATKGLRVEPDGTCWLQSPESRYPVTVEDVPFIIVDYDIENPGPDQNVTLITNMDEKVTLGPERTLALRPEPKGGVAVPYIEIRPGLYARMNRPVYYKLVALAGEVNGKMMLRSGGVNHILGMT